MTNSPDPGSEPNSDLQRRRRLRRLRQIGIPLGVVTLAGVAGGAWWGWNFVHTQLVPLVQTSLSKSLNRPVLLGRVEGVSLTSLTVGPSSVPATATDPDRVTIQRVKVGFNPLKVLFTRNLNLDITLVKPEIYLEQDQKGAWVATQISQEESTGPVKTELEVIRFQDAKATLVPKPKLGTGKGIPINLAQLNGNARLFDKNQRFTYEVSGISETGGKLDLTGETLRTPLQTNLKVRGQNFLVSEIDRLVNLPAISLEAGRVDGDVSVQLLPNQKTPTLGGTAQFKGVTLKVPQVPQNFSQAKGGLELQGSLIRLKNVTALYGKVPLSANGDVDFQKGFNVAAKVKPTSLPTVLQTLKVPLPFAVAGAVKADLKLTGPIQQPVLSGIAQNTRPGKIDKVDLSRYTAQFRLDTAAKLLAISDIQATPAAGGQVTGAGRIQLANPARLAIVINAVNVPGDAIALGYSNGNALPFRVGRVNAQAQITGPATAVQTLARWQAAEGTYPASGEILVANGVTTLRNTTASVAGGTANIQARAANGRWQATVAGAGIQLSRFSRDLRGLFSGNFALSGSLSSFNPADIRAQGQARLSQGISVIDQPLTAQVQWDGQKVIVQRASAPGFSANGAIFAKLQGPGAPAITALDLNVRASDYNLQAFNLPVPAKVSYSGRADFAGRLQGTPAAPNIAGGLTLRRFVLNGVAFEPVLRGSVRVANGVNLDLAGIQDRIAVVLNSAYRPVAFDIRRGDAVATGRAQGDLLLVDAQNFPLEILGSLGPTASLPASGRLSGNLAVNLRTYSASGQVAIDRPGFGAFRADQFGGRISFANGVATLTDAELRRGTSVFQLNGTATLQGSSPRIKGQLKVAQGQLQDVLAILQVFDLQDLLRGFQPPTYGSAADVQAVPVDLTNSPVLDQLRRLSEVQALIAQKQADREDTAIPPLDELSGTFSGEVNVDGSLATGINASFNLRGENWEWGPYSAKEVVAIGSFEKGALTLLPLRFQSDQSVIAFSGQVGGKTQSGQFRMENVPLDTLKRLSPSAVPPIEGNLNVTATLAGSLNNPQAIGELSLTNGSLNGKDIQKAEGSFQYANARLDFGSQIFVATADPITISGSLPVPLPFTAVQPANDQISLDINVKDDGLAVLNLLNNQVEWISGRGEVVLRARGTLQRPDVKGVIRVQDGTLQAGALPEPLTNVNGVIDFNSDRVDVRNVRGQFSKGQVSASGVLPIATPFDPNDPDAGRLIDVNLDNIALSLKGLYQGSVNGKVQVGGAALSPELSGLIRLSDGQVLLSDAAQRGGGSASGGATTGEGAATGEESESQIKFANLKLELGDRVRITRAPLLNFVATGNLIINGTITEPRPNGVITLRSGQVNLFTTQFNLERGYPQTAEFQPNQGLDPNLDIRLVTLVPEVTGSRLPTEISSSEILDAPNFNRYGSAQTIRIQARVLGPASELTENLFQSSQYLELTSSPPRSSAEIVSLIGGNFVSSLGQGNAALGLANLAGSALLTNVQTVIGNALGLSDFRLYPAISPNTSDSRASRRSSNIDLVMDAGIDITRSLGLSVQKVLTTDQPAQFGLRYRLNEQFTFRGSSDFSGDNRAVVEYETRF
jgi:translocation and assembly module TamB